MPKNIVICCDGTNNQISKDVTNVFRTYQISKRTEKQVTFYDCGVGTLPMPWDEGQLAQRLSLINGLATGSGLMDNIEDAYRFLVDVYEEGDLIFLFGFSRGAYTVRALAAMLHSVGLLRPELGHLVRYGQDYWRKPGNRSVCDLFKSTMARSCKVHFLGLWDTVSSVGYPNQFKSFPYTMRNPSVVHVRHAVAIDERRCFFRQNLMFSCTSPHSVKNVWFAGVHSDIGGGYLPEEAGLAKIAFEWMIREAEDCGLEIDEAGFQKELFESGAKPDPLANQHESLAGWWRVAEFIPVRSYIWKEGQANGDEKAAKKWRLPLGAPRNVWRHCGASEVFLHDSVLKRIKAGGYHPANIENSEGELKRRFKIETTLKKEKL